MFRLVNICLHIQTGGNMKIHNPLDKILNNEIKIKILRQLCKTNEESSGRQIADEIKVSPAACHKALHELYSQKVLNFRNIGNTHLYSLNSKNIVVDTLIKSVFSQESQIPEAIYKVIKSGLSKSVRQKIVSLAIFGSLANKKEKASSDIDILILVKDKNDISEVERSIYETGEEISSKFGSTLSPYIQTVDDFKKKNTDRLPVIFNILNSHKLIMGEPLEGLIKNHGA